MKRTSFRGSQIALSDAHRAILFSLDTPQKVQDYVSAIPQNFERHGGTCMTVVQVLQAHRAHCIEGALLAALAFWMQGMPPLVMDLSANDHDDDHVIAPFRINGLWGAISKGNHAYVRYRDPVYRSPRELAMSYFHEYYNQEGDKTLRTYSQPFDLRSMPNTSWVNGEDSWGVAERLCEIPHERFLPVKQEKLLRPIEDIERKIMKFRVHTR